jgi:hypothetical protein
MMAQRGHPQPQLHRHPWLKANPLSLAILLLRGGPAGIPLFVTPMMDVCLLLNPGRMLMAVSSDLSTLNGCQKVHGLLAPGLHQLTQMMVPLPALRGLTGFVMASLEASADQSILSGYQSARGLLAGHLLTLMTAVCHQFYPEWKMVASADQLIPSEFLSGLAVLLGLLTLMTAVCHQFYPELKMAASDDQLTRSEFLSDLAVLLDLRTLMMAVYPDLATVFATREMTVVSVDLPILNGCLSGYDPLALALPTPMMVVCPEWTTLASPDPLILSECPSGHDLPAPLQHLLTLMTGVCQSEFSPALTMAASDDLSILSVCQSEYAALPRHPQTQMRVAFVGPLSASLTKVRMAVWVDPSTPIACQKRCAEKVAVPSPRARRQMALATSGRERLSAPASQWATTAALA